MSIDEATSSNFSCIVYSRPHSSIIEGVFQRKPERRTKALERDIESQCPRTIRFPANI